MDAETLEGMLPSPRGVGPDALERLSAFNEALSRCLSSGVGPPPVEVMGLLEDAANRYLDLASELLRAYPAYRAVG